MNSKRNIASRSGFALLAVLMIVMVITVMSLGFLSRSDVELACGRNMEKRVQIDYLAESGLEHARGLILNPQDVAGEYWTGEPLQQLVAGSSDYYDLVVVRDNTDPNDRCNYIIDSNSYRLESGQKKSQSDLRATLRLDPCIALWTGSDTALWSGITVTGDVSCGGALSNAGAIDGDTFTAIFSGNNPTGQSKPVGNLGLAWPRVTVADFTANYAVQTIPGGTISFQMLGPYNPVRVCYRSGSLTVAGNVRIEGMLIVDGDLSVQNSTNMIIASKNVPALLVTGDLVVGTGGELVLQGLAVVDGNMEVSAGAAGVNVLGGLFIRGALVETTADSSGNGNSGTIFGAEQTFVGPGYALNFDGVDDYVRIAADPALDNLAAMTITASIYPRVDSHWHVLDKGDGHKRLFSEGSNRTLDGLMAQVSSSAYSESAGGTIALNTWQHVAMTWSEATGTTRLFHKGTEVAYNIQNTGSGVGRDDSSYPFVIGTRGNLAGIMFFDGMINDVRLYNRVIDPNDIYPPDDSLPGLVGHWKLDEIGANVRVTAAPARTAILMWSAAGTVEKWGQAAGAFFKSIERR